MYIKCAKCDGAYVDQRKKCPYCGSGRSLPVERWGKLAAVIFCILTAVVLQRASAKLDRDSLPEVAATKAATDSNEKPGTAPIKE